MASGNSSGKPGSGSRSYDFGSDDVLCSYDDLGSVEGPNGNRSDSPVKDFRERRTGRPPANVYSQQDGSYSKNDVVSAVDRCMKKYVDNLLNFLEGISGRLSQLEVYCYNLENSVGELRSDLLQDKKESESKLKSVEKHLQEVHRSVQILRDKQELADTQKELAKLQLAQKDSSDRVASSASEQKKCEDTPDPANRQLALAFPKQAIAQSSLPGRSPELSQAYHQQIPAQLPTPPLNMQQAPPMLNQGTTFLPQQNQPVSVPPPYQHSEGQYIAQRSQSQDISAQSPPQPPQPQGQSAAFPQYQQQWSQQTSQRFPQQQQPPRPQVQFQTQSPPVYPPYPSHQPPKATEEKYPGSAPMPTSYSMVPQSSGIRPEGVPFGYGGLGGTVQQPPPAQSLQRQTPMQSSQNLPGPQPNTSGYMNSPPYPPQSGLHGYMGYGNDGNRTLPSQSFNPGNYPPNPQTQQQAPGSMIPFQHQNTHPTRSHPYGELIEKAVGMGYPRDSVVNAIYRMEQSGQPIDFNALLDMLNSTSSAGHRGW